jgi:hypothetical protein
MECSNVAANAEAFLKLSFGIANRRSAVSCPTVSTSSNNQVSQFHGTEKNHGEPYLMSWGGCLFCGVLLWTE